MVVGHGVGSGERGAENRETGGGRRRELPGRRVFSAGGMIEENGDAGRLECGWGKLVVCRVRGGWDEPGAISGGGPQRGQVIRRARREMGRAASMDTEYIGVGGGSLVGV